MENERQDPVERLHELLVGGETLASATELEGTYNLIEEEALELVHGGDRGKLDPFWQRLRRIYETLAARSPEDFEENALYHLGRVVELTELLGVAAEHTHPTEVMELLGREGCRELLVALRDAPADRRTSTALGENLGWEKSVLSRRLKRLGELGLVLSRRSGQHLFSQLTPLGEQALRDIGAPPPARRGESFWQPDHLQKKVAIP